MGFFLTKDCDFIQTSPSLSGFATSFSTIPTTNLINQATTTTTTISKRGRGRGSRGRYKTRNGTNATTRVAKLKQSTALMYTHPNASTPTCQCRSAWCSSDQNPLPASSYHQQPQQQTFVPCTSMPGGFQAGSLAAVSNNGSNPQKVCINPEILRRLGYQQQPTAVTTDMQPDFYNFQSLNDLKDESKPSSAEQQQFLNASPPPPIDLLPSGDGNRDEKTPEIPKLNDDTSFLF